MDMEEESVQEIVQNRVEVAKLEHEKEADKIVDEDSHRETVEGRTIDIGQISSYTTVEAYKSVRVGRGCTELTVVSSKDKLAYVEVGSRSNLVDIKCDVNCVFLSERCFNVTFWGNIDFLYVSEKNTNIRVKGSVEHMYASDEDSVTVDGTITNKSY